MEWWSVWLISLAELLIELSRCDIFFYDDHLSSATMCKEIVKYVYLFGSITLHLQTYSSFIVWRNSENIQTKNLTLSYWPFHFCRRVENDSESMPILFLFSMSQEKLAETAIFRNFKLLVLMCSHSHYLNGWSIPGRGVCLTQIHKINISLLIQLEVFWPARITVVVTDLEFLHSIMGYLSLVNGQPYLFSP